MNLPFLTSLLLFQIPHPLHFHYVRLEQKLNISSYEMHICISQELNLVLHIWDALNEITDHCLPYFPHLIKGKTRKIMKWLCILYKGRGSGATTIPFRLSGIINCTNTNTKYKQTDSDSDSEEFLQRLLLLPSDWLLPRLLFLSLIAPLNKQRIAPLLPLSR